MTTAQRQLYTGWGASIAFHVVVLLILAATGLFATFSQSEEKPPVDITVYDASGAAAPAAGGDSAPAPSARHRPSIFPSRPIRKYRQTIKNKKTNRNRTRRLRRTRTAMPAATPMKRAAPKAAALARAIRKKAVLAAVAMALLQVMATP